MNLKQVETGKIKQSKVALRFSLRRLISLHVIHGNNILLLTNFYLPKEKCPQFPNVVKTSGELTFFPMGMLRITQTHACINSVLGYTHFPYSQQRCN